MNQSEIIEAILKLKKEKNAVILAHYYTLPEVQSIADYVGDSLALAQAAVKTEADIILFAGVHFMAETAKILNPNKKVLLPRFEAGCSLADSCSADALAEFMKQHPDHILLSYVNCSAAVKTLSDCIVTSGNALRVVESLPEDAKVVFAPDRNLGAYINAKLHRNMVLWDGACHVHDKLSAADVQTARQKYPNALIMAHPECRMEVLDKVDFVGSTAAMLKFVKSSSNQEFVVMTEEGILFEMQKQNTDRKFHAFAEISASGCLQCQYMKMNSLENIFQTLKDETPELILDEELMKKARKPIEKMLAF